MPQSLPIKKDGVLPPLRLEYLDPADLADNPANWRTHPNAQTKALKDVVAEVGFAGALLYNEGTGRLIDGHARKGLFKGQKVPVLIGSWTEEQERKILATLDPLSAMAQPDQDALLSLLQSVEFESKAVNDLLEAIANSETQPLNHIGGDDGLYWKPEEDTTTGEGAFDLVGYDLGSVWMREGDAESKVFEYLLPLPPNPGKAHKGAMIPNYSRSPAREMQWIVKTYMRPGDYFLEVCAGWWTFSTVAALNGYNGEGIDLWEESVRFGRRQLAQVPPILGKVKQTLGDALHLPYADNSFSFVYCNPPFWQLERYSKDTRDLGNYSTKEEWLKASADMMAEMLRVVKPAGLIVTVMADYREGGILVPLHADWIKAAEERGLKLHDIVIQHLLSQQVRFWRHAYKARRTAKAHEYVIVFRKLGMDGESGEKPLSGDAVLPEGDIELSG